MMIREIQEALTALIRNVVTDVNILGKNVPKVIDRPYIKIDVLPAKSAAACANAHERSITVEIRYYPNDSDHTQDDSHAVAELLMEELTDGFAVGQDWLYIDEDINYNTLDGIPILQFKVSWIETVDESGEPMETVIYYKEENVHGSNNAPN